MPSTTRLRAMLAKYFNYSFDIHQLMCLDRVSGRASRALQLLVTEPKRPAIHKTAR